MPIATGKLSLRTGMANKTNSAVLNAVMNFLVNSGNYTVITNQITASNYFVVQSTRNTGFTGDRIVAQIGINTKSYGTLATWPHLYIIPYESWSGTTGTNAGITFTNASATNSALHFAQDHTWFSLADGQDNDIYISCDDNFILMMNRMYWTTSNVFAYLCNFPVGVVGIQRLSGDNDSGTFYGHFGLEQADMNSYRIYVPKRFDGVTASSSFYNISTMLGSTTLGSGRPYGLYGTDESNNHVCFDIYAHLASSSRVKGILYGIKAMPIGYYFDHAGTFTIPSGKRYMFGKYANRMSSGFAMEIASTITNITL